MHRLPIQKSLLMPGDNVTCHLWRKFGQAIVLSHGSMFSIAKVSRPSSQSSVWTHPAFLRPSWTPSTLLWHRLDPWPDSVPGLQRLRRRFIVAPLSNGNLRLMLDMAKRAGLPWDAILGAEIVQAYKPTPEAYLRTAEVLMLKPEQICLVAARTGFWRGCGRSEAT
jgi:HAD superfamily hydrolase (TIGR01493 family)